MNKNDRINIAKMQGTLDGMLDRLVQAERNLLDVAIRCDQSLSFGVAIKEVTLEDMDALSSLQSYTRGAHQEIGFSYHRVHNIIQTLKRFDTEIRRA